MEYFLRIFGGVVIGLIVAAPIGPVNLICIRRTVAYGPANGFLSGLGAALGDGTFAVIAAFGLTAVSQLVMGYAEILQFVGGLLMIGFGIHTYHALVEVSEDSNSDQPGSASLIAAFASTFALTITNPATLLGFAALFAGFGGLAETDATFFNAMFTIGGVLAGSAAWWFTITTVTGILHRRINPSLIKHINQVAGALVTCFGVVILARLAASWLL